MTKTVELALVLVVAVTATTWAGWTQKVQVTRYWDARHYNRMTEQLAAGQPPSTAAPYVYRILVPWIVSWCCAGTISRGFLIVNLVSGVATAVLLAVWLQSFVTISWIRLLMVAAFAWQWHAPLRFSHYYPVYVDPLFIAALLAALVIVEQMRPVPTVASQLGLTIVAIVGTLVRETMLLVPIAMLFGSGTARPGKRVTRGCLVALIGAVLAWGALHVAIVPQRDYSLSDAFWQQLLHKPAMSLLLAWFTTFGPMLAVVLYDWREASRFLARRVDLLALFAGYVGLAFVGGQDTERLLFWAMPVVYVLVGRAIERHRHILAGIGITVTLVLTQLLAERVLWPVPDPGGAVAAMSDMPDWSARLASSLDRLFVMSDFHWNLWSNFGSRPFHLALLGWYLALTALLVGWMHLRARQIALLPNA